MRGTTHIEIIFVTQKKLYLPNQLKIIKFIVTGGAFFFDYE